MMLRFSLRIAWQQAGKLKVEELGTEGLGFEKRRVEARGVAEEPRV
jgi:hypothetical protein